MALLPLIDERKVSIDRLPGKWNKCSKRTRIIRISHVAIRPVRKLTPRCGTIRTLKTGRLCSPEERDT